jgi:hypothetical protein
MGYTHYWKFNQQPTPEKFTEFVEGAQADNCDSRRKQEFPIGEEAIRIRLCAIQWRRRWSA